MKKLLVIAAAVILFSACKKSGEEPKDGLVDPNNPEAISNVLQIPNSSVRTGAFPAPTTSAQAPSVSLSSANSYTTSNGSTLPVTFLYNNLSAAFGGIYFRVDGAASYRNITSSSSSSSSGSITVLMGVPQNVDSGQFRISFCIYDASSRVSNIITRTIKVVRLGTGSIQINLAWDTDRTDVDLHLTEPGNNEIYFNNPTSTTGGFLDRDDVDGFGPENIFFQNSMPDGTYKVSLVYYSTHGVTVPTNCVVTINTAGKSKTFNKTLTSASTVTKYDITSVTKSGTNYTY